MKPPVPFWFGHPGPRPTPRSACSQWTVSEPQVVAPAAGAGVRFRFRPKRAKLLGCLAGLFLLAAGVHAQPTNVSVSPASGSSAGGAAQTFTAVTGSGRACPSPSHSRRASRRRLSFGCRMCCTRSAPVTASWCRSKARGSRWSIGIRNNSWIFRMPVHRISRRRWSACIVVERTARICVCSYWNDRERFGLAPLQRNIVRERVHQSSHQTRSNCKGSRAHRSAGAREAAPASIGLVAI
jgi:hypothetical protein